jgi:hypothetical protein
MKRSEQWILRRLQTLPLSPVERDQALRQVRLGQDIAALLLGIRRLFAHKAAPRVVTHHR